MLFIRKGILISFIIFIFQIYHINHSYGVLSDKEEESFLITASARKLMEVITFPFNCCLSVYEDESHNKPSQFLKIQYQNIIDQEDPPIMCLPQEVIYIMTDYLSPLDIMRLFRTCKYFSFLKDNLFWNYYNYSHNYYIWDKSIPLIKITFAHFWYNEGNIKKSAHAGFPKAIEKIKLNETSKNQIDQGFVSSNHYNYKINYDIFGKHLPNLSFPSVIGYHKRRF